MSNAPLARSLTPADLEVRLAEWRELRSEALRETTEGRVTTTVWASRPGLAERLAALVEAERSCCPFLGLGIAEEDGRIVLTTTWPGPELDPIEERP